MALDPQLSAFALGLLLGAAKIGFVGTVGFGIGWWRTHRKLRELQSTLPNPVQVEERLASLEQAVDFAAAQMDRLIEGQTAIVTQLSALPVQSRPNQLPPASS